MSAFRDVGPGILAELEVDFHVHKRSVSDTFPVGVWLWSKSCIFFGSFPCSPYGFYLLLWSERHPAHFPQSTDTNADRTSKSSGRRVVRHSFFCFPCLTHLLSQENRFPLSRGWVSHKALSPAHPFLLLINVYFALHLHLLCICLSGMQWLPSRLTLNQSPDVGNGCNGFSRGNYLCCGKCPDIIHVKLYWNL